MHYFRSELGRQISKIYTHKVTKLSFDNPAFKGNESFSRGKTPIDEWNKGELDWVCTKILVNTSRQICALYVDPKNRIAENQQFF